MPPAPDLGDPFHGRLGFGERPAFVIVDMCRAYFSADSPLDTGQPDVAVACRTLLGLCRAAGVPVAWTRVEIPADSRSVFRRKVPALAHLAPGAPLGDWVSGLVPADGEHVVTKTVASGFFGTGLAGHLRALDVDTAIIAGVSTSGCVRATALDACQHDFVPIVVREACGDRDQAAHDQTLRDLDAKYADVVSLGEVIEEVRRITAS